MGQKVASIPYYLFATGLLFVSPVSVFAATLNLYPVVISRTVGSTFSVSVHVSSIDRDMNAASGVITFPTDKLEVAGISRTNSIMNFWVQEPSFSNSSGTISFEGVIFNPGYTGKNGEIMTITFRTKSAGQANLKVSSGSVLANDGIGTNILNELGHATISIQAITQSPTSNRNLVLSVTKEQANETNTESKPALPGIPIITSYQEEVERGDTIKVQGIANPGVDIEVHLQSNNQPFQQKVVRATASGSFVVAFDDVSKSGVYTFFARAIDEAGNKSPETSAFTIVVKETWLNKILKAILDYLSLTVLLGLALTGVVVGFVFVWYRMLSVIRRMSNKNNEAEEVSEKIFQVLHAGVKQHVARLKQTKRELTEEEADFLEQFDQKLGEAKETITKEIQDISHS